MAVTEDHLIELDNSLSFEEGAAIPEAWLTAYQLLNNFLEVQYPEENKGKTALIYAGASGVGTALIQLCKLRGLSTIAVASSEAKL